MTTTTTTTKATGIYVNLAVENLDRSIAFFKDLGFTFDPTFTDATATCMILGDNIHAMLMTREKFQSFAPVPLADARATLEVLTCLSVDSRERVDELVRRAVAGGGSTYKPPEDHGFMYWHAFRDLDGHVWELAYMDAAAVAKMREAAK